MSIWNNAEDFTDFLRLPRPQGERRTEHKCASSAQPKSVDSPWGRGETIDFQALLDTLFNISDSHIIVKHFLVS